MVQRKQFDELDDLFNNGLTMNSLPVGLAAGAAARVLDIDNKLIADALDALTGRNWRGKVFFRSNSEEDQANALAKAVQNPVSSLISVPLQNNTNFDIGPNDRTQNILNVQPVIPVRVSEKWNLIMRIITPIIYQPSIASLVISSNTPLNHLGTLGLGDMNPTFFLSPAKAKKLIWGRPVVSSANCNRRRSWTKKMEHWAVGGPADATGTLDDRRIDQQPLVICWQR